MNKLLTEQELVAELWSGIVKHDSLAASQIGYPSQETEAKIIDLINSQKLAHADKVIGGDQAAEDNIYPTEEGKELWRSLENAKAVRNGLRAEQRKKNVL